MKNTRISSLFFFPIVALTALQAAEEPLTQEAVEKALADPEKAKSVEITIWFHSEKKEEGFFKRVNGAGDVSVGVGKVWYPITATETTSQETLRLKWPPEKVRELAALFADSKLLALPKIRKEWATPTKSGGRVCRYSLCLRFPGVGDFECEYAQLTIDEDQIPSARKIIETLEHEVAGLQEKIRQEDAKFLTHQRIKDLLEKGTGKLTLELHDIEGHEGGVSVRLRPDGEMLGLAVPPGQGGRNKLRSQQNIGAEKAQKIFLHICEAQLMDFQPKRKTGAGHEARPELVLEAEVEGIRYRRAIALWAGEARDTPAFNRLWQDFWALAAPGKTP